MSHESKTTSRRRVSVAILVPTLNRSAGGVERFSSLLEEQLQKSFDVTLVAAPQVTGRWLKRLGLSSIARALRSRGALKRLRPDILVTNGAMGAVGNGPWRRVHVYHGTLPSHFYADRGGRRVRDWLVAGTLGGGLSEFLSGLGAVRVAVSKSAADEVHHHYRFSRPIVIENGVRVTTRQRDAEARRLVLYVGRRESRKGYENAVEGASLAGSRLSVAGPGADDRTEDLGLLSESEVSSALARSIALVLPTRYEACSLAILEALAHGCPVVTTEVGWMRNLVQVVPAYSKLVVPLGDSKAIADILVRLQSGDRDLWAAVDSARALVSSRNSLEYFGGEWTSLLRKIGREL